MFYRPVPEHDPEDVTGSDHIRIEPHSQGQHAFTPPTKSHASFDRIFKILTLLLLAILCILATLDVLLRSQQAHTEPIWSIQREYGSKHHYMSLDPQYDYLWREENDARNALIYLSMDEETTDREEVGSISMFHQLHCLTSIRAVLQRASHGEDIGQDWRDNVHWPHCLHYLRESILCFAEPTIETGRVVNGTKTRGIDGAQEVRTCRDADQLFELRRRDGVQSRDGARVGSE